MSNKHPDSHTLLADAANGTPTRQSAAEAQPSALTALESALLSNVSDSVIFTNLDGIVTFWNEGATRLFGWTAEEMMGQPLIERFPEHARAQIANSIMELAS